MALELIAVQGCTIGHGLGSTVTGGVFTITTPPSTKTLAGSPIYSGPIAFTFTGGSEPTASPGSVTGTGTINPTATKVSETLAVVREGDTGTMVWVGISLVDPPPTVGGSVPVEITVAGQIKVKAQ